MSENAKVKYGTFLFGQTEDLPIPFVGVDREYVKAGERWTILNRVSLSGEIIGCTKKSLVDSQNAILAAFNEDFKTLEISGLDNMTLAKVISINFEGSDYLAAISYSIELEAYDYSQFSSTNFPFNSINRKVNLQVHLAHEQYRPIMVFLGNINGRKWSYNSRHEFCGLDRCHHEMRSDNHHIRLRALSHQLSLCRQIA